MRDLTTNFGQNAGKIWLSLNNVGPQSQSSLIKNTKLSLPDFYAGLGWLARENKIFKEGKYYKLGDTNLTDIIGEDAGKVWRLLETQGDINISSIVKTARIKIQDAYTALGWLAREDKIKTNIQNNQIKFLLK